MKIAAKEAYTWADLSLAHRLLILAVGLFLSHRLILVFTAAGSFETQVETYEAAVNAEDMALAEAIFAPGLLKRFTVDQLTSYHQKIGMVDVEGVSIVDAHIFKAKGRAHLAVQTPRGQQLLRADFREQVSIVAIDWQLSNFCNIRQDLEMATARFLKHLKRGEHQKAFSYTVDHAFPRRAATNFKVQDLKDISQHLELQRDTQIDLGKMRLSEDGVYYHMPIAGPDFEAELEFLFWRYGRQGCEFNLLHWRGDGA